MSEAMKTDGTIDITDVVCPITFVKVKPRSLKDEDHKVLSVKKREDGTYDLIVKKHGLLE